MSYIIIDEYETKRIGLDKLCLAKQNTEFGVSFWGFYDRYYPPNTKRYCNRWCYKVINNPVFLRSILKYEINNVCIIK